MDTYRMKKNWIRAIMIVVLILFAFLIRSGLDKKEIEKQSDKRETKREMDYAPFVKKDNAILAVFTRQYPEAKVVLACEEDITDDGNADLVVICQLEGHIRTVVLLDSGDQENYYFTDPIPAPVENQKIQFKNIDKEAEIEVIITGEKKGAVGYAIYRVIDQVLTDLFGEGMEDCC